jgi:predicted nuclease with TOPRIM domain
VKELVTQAKEENAPELTPLQELIEEKESLLMEEARIKARIKEIKARVSELEDEISGLTGGN